MPPSFKNRLLKKGHGDGPVIHPLDKRGWNQFEDEGAFRRKPWTRANIRNDIDRGIEIVQSEPENFGNYARDTLKAYLGQGGHNINEPVPVDWPLPPARNFVDEFGGGRVSARGLKHVRLKR